MRNHLALLALLALTVGLLGPGQGPGVVDWPESSIDAQVLDAVADQCSDAETLLGDTSHTCVDLAATYQPLDAELTTLGGLTETEGSILIGNATPAWSALGIGAANAVLLSSGTTAAWDATPAIDCTDCTNVASQDKISEGDSFVEVTDAGTGEVVIDVDAEDLVAKVGGADQINITSTTGVDTIDIAMEVQVTKFTADDKTVEPGNKVGLYDNDTAFTNDPTCANSGAASEFTLIDKDESATDIWVACDGTTEILNLETAVEGTGVATHGPAFWAISNGGAMDSGDEVCPDQNLTCQDVIEFSTVGTPTDSTCAATHANTVKFIAFCK